MDFPVKNNPEILDPSSKMDLDFLGLFWMGKTSVLYCISLVIRRFFPFQNNPKNLDLSYKMDLGLWDCLGRVKLLS